MNRRELREQVYVRTGFDSADAMVTASVVNAAINDALNYISLSHDWPWLESSETLTTAISTNYVTPSETWLRTKSLTNSDGTQMFMISIADFDLLGAATGQPEQYAIFAGKFYIWPTPDSDTTITHRFIRTESELTDDTSSPILPDSFQPASTELAASYVLARVRDEDRSNVARARYLDWEKKMDDNRRRYEQPPRIRVRPGGWIP